MNCLICAKALKEKQSKFCCHEHYALSRMRHKCQFCGTTLEPHAKESVVAFRKRRFCGSACAARARAKANRPWAYRGFVIERALFAILILAVVILIACLT